MHNTLPQGVKSIRALLQRIKKYLQQALNNWHGITRLTITGRLMGEQIDLS